MMGQALQVMLFGMLGVFIVMGIIAITIKLLNRPGKKDDSPQN